MSNCILCTNDIDQTEVLQTILDNREDGRIDWLNAKRELQERYSHNVVSTLTLTTLKKHTDQHVTIRQVDSDD